MNRYKFIRPFAIIAGLCLALAAVAAQAADPAPAYLDPKWAVAERIDDLLPRMTLEEKVLQLTDDWGCPAIPRLKIPALLKTEGLHGNSYSNGGTIFPEGIAMAATWDPTIVFEIGKATAVESKAAGIRQSWSPVLDVVRDGRWGRVEETYGEDPWLVSRMGVAWITGFQGEGMISTPKHFAGHGFPLGGRDSNDIGLSERTMREIELPPFRAAFEEAHAGGVMAAYGTWEGVPDNASKALLQDILRQEWGFDGMVVTDCSAIEHFVVKHAITDNYEAASWLALEAGVNIECGQVWRKFLAKAVQDGLVSEAQVNDALRPVLAAKFKPGLFDHPSQADAVVMVMGDSWVNPGLNKKIESTIGENKDGATLAIPGARPDLIKEVAALGKPLVLDIVNGKPFVLSWEDENVPAAFPLGQWVHVAYVYDHAAGKGTIFRDGKVDVQKNQKPYEGALEMVGTTPMTHGGKFTMKEVLVLNGALSEAARTLSKDGPVALKSGQYQSEWRPVAAGDAVPAKLVAPANLPAGSHVSVVVETGDASGKAVDHKSVELAPGKASYVLDGLKPGAQVRVRVEIKVDRWDASPAVASITLKGKNLDLRWITPAQWTKGLASGGVRLTE